MDSSLDGCTTSNNNNERGNGYSTRRFLRTPNGGVSIQIQERYSNGGRGFSSFITTFSRGIHRHPQPHSLLSPPNIIFNQIHNHHDGLENASYEDLLQMFGDGSDNLNRGADAATIHSLPLHTI